MVVSIIRLRKQGPQLNGHYAVPSLIAVNHFLPGITKTSFHPNKKDLSYPATAMWDAVENAHNKILGTNEKEWVEIQPVLPNLVTMTMQ